MIERLIIGGIATIALVVLNSYLNGQSKKTTPSGLGGAFEMRLIRFYYYAGVFCMLLAATGAGLCLYLLEGFQKWIVTFGVITVFGIYGMISYLWYVNHMVYFNSEKITVYSILNTKSTINWNQIEKVKFNATTGVLKITGVDKTKVKIHGHLFGFSEVINAIEKYTKFETEKLRLP